MKIPFVHGPNDLRIDDILLPEPGPRDAVIRVATVGICGSDLNYVALGGIAGPADKPMPLGHELAGTISELGSEVSGFSVGQRVLVNPIFNFIGNGGPEGGFANELLVRDIVGNPASLMAMPAEMDFDTGALIEPLAVARHGVNRLGAKAGDKVALFGAGPIGLGAIVSLRHRGVEDIVVFDLSPFRRERALALGARAAFDPRENPPEQTLTELHGTALLYGYIPKPGTTHYLEASGAPVLPEIVEYARFGAIIAVVSIQKKPVTLNLQTMLAKEMSLITSMGYPTEFAEVLNMLQEQKIDLAPMISHHFSGADFMDAFAMAKRQDQAAKVLVHYSN
jgi:(R,R)-butanediol dehydrogenase / meso-butanediol dehydrogenase / diacetyl reductase